MNTNSVETDIVRAFVAVGWAERPIGHLDGQAFAETVAGLRHARQFEERFTRRTDWTERVFAIPSHTYIVRARVPIAGTWDARAE